MATSNFTTSDLYAAAALKAALNLPFPDILLQGRMSAFVFAVEPKEAQKILDQFYNDSLQIPAREYGQNLRDLKTMICQRRDSAKK